MHTKGLSSFILAADIGGSHITAGMYDPEAQVILKNSTARNEVKSNGPANGILSSWANAFDQVLKNVPMHQPEGVSIAMPGPFDYEEGISYIQGLGKYEAIYGMDIKSYLAALLNMDGNCIKFRNDAESTIAGEVLTGAGKNYKKLLGITLGTGFGSAFSDNKITRDLNLGSDPFMDTIADDHLSTRWFVKRYQQLTGKTLTGGVRQLSGLAANEDTAKELFSEFAVNLTTFLSGYIEALKPDALIICGNIAKAHAYFLPDLRSGLKIPVKLAELGEDAALVGAASVFDKKMGQEPLNSKANQ